MTDDGCVKLALVVGLGLFARYVYRAMFPNNKSVPKQKPIEEINEVLFFPDREYACNTIVDELMNNINVNRFDPLQDVDFLQQFCYNPSCRRLHGRMLESKSSMLKFLKYLSSAHYSVDICIFLLTQQKLADMLLELHRMHVKIRIITDSCEDDAQTSQIARLSRANIEVRSNKRGTGALMHHKFVIIDDEILLTGSFNWTNKAIVSNHEAILVTSNRHFVTAFSDQFHNMWSLFAEHSRRSR